MGLLAIENHSQLEHLALSKPANSRQNIANWTYAPAKSLISLNALLNIIHVIRIRAREALRQAGRIGWNPLPGAVGGGCVCIYKNAHTLDPHPYPLATKPYLL